MPCGRFRLRDGRCMRDSRGHRPRVRRVRRGGDRRSIHACYPHPRVARRPDAGRRRHLRRATRGVALAPGRTGRPDRSFGTDGVVAMAPHCGTSMCVIDDIAVAGDHVYLLLNGARVVRLQGDGTIDRSFATAGFATLDGAPKLLALAVDDARRPVAAGSVSPPNSAYNTRGVLYRLTPYGTPDTSFGNDPAHRGRVHMAEGEFPAGLAVEPGGSLVGARQCSLVHHHRARAALCDDRTGRCLIRRDLAGGRDSQGAAYARPVAGCWRQGHGTGVVRR